MHPCNAKLNKHLRGMLRQGAQSNISTFLKYTWSCKNFLPSYLHEDNYERNSKA